MEVSQASATGSRDRVADVLLRLPADYFSQVTAGYSEVRATGTLERFSGRWHLLEPGQIEVMSPPPPSSTSTPFHLGDASLRRPSEDPELRQVEPGTGPKEIEPPDHADDDE